MTERHLTWHAGLVGAAQRAEAFGHRGATVWLTGLSGSGKSTIAREAEQLLIEKGVHAYVLDGDNLRLGLNSDLGFSAQDRQENIRRVGELACLFTDAGLVVLTAFISPFRVDRSKAREAAMPGTFFEVHVATPLEICEARDPKGLYRSARAGRLADFTGVDSPYEAPLSPDLVVGATGASAVNEASRIVAMLTERGVLPSERVK